MIAISSASFLGRMLWKLPITKQNTALSLYFKKIDEELPNEYRLFFFTLLLYGSFITWGYLQEKITLTFYITNDPLYYQQEKIQWKYPLVLNLFVNISAVITSFLVQTVFQSDQPCYLPSNTETPPKNPHPQALNHKILNRKTPFYVYLRPALSATFATSLSYVSLDYISYPLMILSKSCKHIPVMLVGVILYQKSYHWTKYVSVLLICFGIGFFTVMKNHNKQSPATISSHQITGDTRDENDFVFSIALMIGLFLVFIHLILDGVTSNEQDRIFTNYSTSSLQMMQNINLWQCIYLIGYLFVEYLWKVHSEDSQLFQAFHMLETAPDVLRDILVFCVCACVGQILIFGLIRRFGSLVWITISVTRQLFTILLSVFLFQHEMVAFQWIGIGFVFSGLGIDIYMNYQNKKPQLLQTAPESTLSVMAATAENNKKRI